MGITKPKHQGLTLIQWCDAAKVKRPVESHRQRLGGRGPKTTASWNLFRLRLAQAAWATGVTPTQYQERLSCGSRIQANLDLFEALKLKIEVMGTGSVEDNLAANELVRSALA